MLYQDEKLGPGWALALPLRDIFSHGLGNKRDDAHRLNVSHTLPDRRAAIPLTRKLQTDMPAPRWHCVWLGYRACHFGCAP